jgi:hypothetical protein
LATAPFLRGKYRGHASSLGFTRKQEEKQKKMLTNLLDDESNVVWSTPRCFSFSSLAPAPAADVGIGPDMFF